MNFFDIPLMAVNDPPMGGAEGVTGASGTPDLVVTFSSAASIRFFSSSWTVFFSSLSSSSSERLRMLTGLKTEMLLLIVLASPIGIALGMRELKLT